MLVCVCLSVSLCARLSPEPQARSLVFTNFFVHVAYVRGSVLLWHVDDRPHRLSAGREWRVCTAWAKCNLRWPCSFCMLCIRCTVQTTKLMAPGLRQTLHHS